MVDKNKDVLIWDIPTRLFHWLLVIGFGLQWLTGRFLDDAIDWHFYIGYSLLGLILFRIIWGFVGTQYAKFTQFLSSPKAAIHYSKTLHKKQSPVHATHNPLGGWVVVIMLFLIGLQAISGLFVSDEIFSEGPYYSVASSNVKDAMAFIHFNLFDVLIGIAALHILAVLVYQLYKKQHLIQAMFHGKKSVDAVGITSSKLILAIFIACLVGVGVYILVAVLPPQPELYF